MEEAGDVGGGGELTGPGQVGHQGALGVPGVGAVEHAVAQYDPLGSLGGDRLEGGDRLDHPAAVLVVGVQIERRGLVGRRLARFVRPRDALRDHPSYAGSERSVDQVAGALTPDPAVRGEVARREVGQLVHDHIRPGGSNHLAERGGVVHVAPHRRHPGHL
jgi:hypothetical protein